MGLYARKSKVIKVIYKNSICEFDLGQMAEWLWRVTQANASGSIETICDFS